MCAYTQYVHDTSKHLGWAPIFIQERDPDWWENGYNCTFLNLRRVPPLKRFICDIFEAGMLDLFCEETYFGLLYNCGAWI